MGTRYWSMDGIGYVLSDIVENNTEQCVKGALRFAKEKLMQTNKGTALLISSEFERYLASDANTRKYIKLDEIVENCNYESIYNSCWSRPYGFDSFMVDVFLWFWEEAGHDIDLIDYDFNGESGSGVYWLVGVRLPCMKTEFTSGRHIAQTLDEVFGDFRGDTKAKFLSLEMWG